MHGFLTVVNLYARAGFGAKKTWYTPAYRISEVSHMTTGFFIALATFALGAYAELILYARAFSI